MELTRLDETILYILDRANSRFKQIGLSKFQLMKINYLIEVESRKFIGEPFNPEFKFVRDKNGPISYQVYESIEKLENEYIKIKLQPNYEYGHTRANHMLIKKPKFNFSKDEIIFLNSVIDDSLKLTQSALKKWVYSTEPMVGMLKEEAEENMDLKKGATLNLNLIALDEDVVEGITSV